MPTARGPASEALLAGLAEPPGRMPPVPMPTDDPLDGDDQHLALYLLYELHYRGLPGVDDRWEWDPSQLAVRGALEARFEAALRHRLEPTGDDAVTPEETDLALRAILEADDAPSVSAYLERDGGHGEILEFLVHRSAYQLKEADPHSFGLPRLWGPPKAAMVTIQADEYGGGRAERIHAQLFADAMDALGLDARYGAYVEQIPGVTLATVNLMSMLGLHRRLRGALVGHLAAFEMGSSLPNARYARALRRLGFDGRATAFFDEHVTADAVHENLAAVDLAGGLARQQPALATDILWGARALVDAWSAGRSSLRARLAAPVPA